MASEGGPMAGKVCMITGATSGLGRVTATELAKLGATVVVHGRDLGKCEAAAMKIRDATGNPQVECLLADLSSLEDVRRFAANFKSEYGRLDVLINNAGAMYLGRAETADGYEMTFGVNHLSHFLLTNLLMDTLKASAPSRIINVSSAAHERATLDFGDLQWRRGYSGWGAYARSKLENILFTYELARRLPTSQVTANALHPGLVATNFGLNNSIMKFTAPVWHLAAISVEEGAKTIVYLASSPDVSGVSGKYFVKQKPVESSKASYDAAGAMRLWQISEELTGLKEGEKT
jgi:retinol dehydrogenase 12